MNAGQRWKVVIVGAVGAWVGWGLNACQVNPTISSPQGYSCADAGDCPQNFYCDPQSGTCQPSPSNGTGTGSGSGSGNGTTSGSQCSVQQVHTSLNYFAGGTVCAPGLDAGAAAGGCGCGQACVVDPYLVAIGATSTTFCETPCSSQVDCQDANAACRPLGVDGGYFCQLNYCGWAPGDAGPNGVFGGLCVVADAGFGTCVDIEEPGSGPAGLCTAGGTAALGDECQSDPQPFIHALLCEPGDACVRFDPDAGSEAGSFVCAVSCDPAADGGCPTGQVCVCSSDFTGTSHGHVGYCVPAFPDGGGTVLCSHSN